MGGFTPGREGATGVRGDLAASVRGRPRAAVLRGSFVAGFPQRRRRPRPGRRKSAATGLQELLPQLCSAEESRGIALGVLPSVVNVPLATRALSAVFASQHSTIVAPPREQEVLNSWPLGRAVRTQLSLTDKWTSYHPGCLTTGSEIGLISRQAGGQPFEEGLDPLCLTSRGQIRACDVHPPRDPRWQVRGFHPRQMTAGLRLSSRVSIRPETLRAQRRLSMELSLRHLVHQHYMDPGASLLTI